MSHCHIIVIWWCHIDIPALIVTTRMIIMKMVVWGWMQGWAGISHYLETLWTPAWAATLRYISHVLQSATFPCSSFPCATIHAVSLHCTVSWHLLNLPALHCSAKACASLCCIVNSCSVYYIPLHCIPLPQNPLKWELYGSHRPYIGKNGQYSGNSSWSFMWAMGDVLGAAQKTGIYAWWK